MKGIPSWLVVVLRVALVALSAVLADGSLGNPVQNGASAALRFVLPQSALGADLSGPPVPLSLCVSCSKRQDLRHFALATLSASGKRSLALRV